MSPKNAEACANGLARISGCCDSCGRVGGQKACLLCCRESRELKSGFRSGSGHTGASGFARLARQALFDGVIEPGSAYFLVDDFIGQGGTLANLKGFIESRGGQVIGATVLTGKPYSARLDLSPDLLAALRAKHGHEFEVWWRDRFGHGFDCLTQSEARYLERSPNAERVRNSLVEVEQAGNCRLD